MSQQKWNVNWNIQMSLQVGDVTSNSKNRTEWRHHQRISQTKNHGEALLFQIKSFFFIFVLTQRSRDTVAPISGRCRANWYKHSKMPKLPILSSWSTKSINLRKVDFTVTLHLLYLRRWTPNKIPNFWIIIWTSRLTCLRWGEDFFFDLRSRIYIWWNSYFVN